MTVEQVVTTPSQDAVERFRDEAERVIAEDYAEQAVAPYLAAAASAILLAAPPFLVVSIAPAAATAAVGVSVVVGGTVLAAAVRAGRLVAPEVSEDDFAGLLRMVRQQVADHLVDEAHAAASEAIRDSDGDSVVGQGAAVRQALDPASWRWRNHVDRVAAALATAAVAEGVVVGAAKVQQRTGRRLALKWVSRRDGHVRPTHRRADGQVRGLGEKFDVGRSKLRWPGDPLGDVSEIAGCRCVVVPTRQAA